METSQWPLTAAATQILLAMPASSSNGGKAPPPKDAVKLGLKELLVRGAYRIQIQHKRLGKDKVTILPQQRPALPSSLAPFDGALRPHTPGEIGKVIKKARTRQSTLIKDIGELFLWELVGRGLVEERKEKVLGVFSRKRWRRTVSGDAWAASGAQHVQRLEGCRPRSTRTPSRPPAPQPWPARSR